MTPDQIADVLALSAIINYHGYEATPEFVAALFDWRDGSDTAPAAPAPAAPEPEPEPVAPPVKSATKAASTRKTKAATPPPADDDPDF